MDARQYQPSFLVQQYVEIFSRENNPQQNQNQAQFQNQQINGQHQMQQPMQSWSYPNNTLPFPIFRLG